LDVVVVEPVIGFFGRSVRRMVLIFATAFAGQS
jgi:hypothetical protein